MRKRRCGGFTYLFALFIVAFMGVGAMAIGTAWDSAAKREREAELLFVGNSYRLAIQRYYLAGQRRYPATLQDLVKDPRTPATQRYIRRLYADPITNSNEWGIVKAPDGGVMGVFSKSEDAPIKTTNFKTRDRDFERGTKYVDWKFVYTPAAPKPAAGAPTPPQAAPPQGSTPPATLTPAAK
ncbi:MAG TPA: type II secretion system protein [Burkholderiales bacterium]|nr:type II secretion system protein [Burkholderiales bacterium]